MKIFSQKNPLWAKKLLGASKLTMAGYGCTTTALAEVNNRFGANCTPDQVAAHKDWYTATGLIMWNALDLQHAVFEWRYYGYNSAKVLEALNDPNNKAVLLEVNMPGAAKHWLKGEAIGNNNVIYARDPIDGSMVDIAKKYGAITGSAHFKKRI